MRKRIRAYLAIGAGAALAFTGLVPATVVTQAVAAEPATIEVQRSLLPAGTTFTVTDPGDTGAGTFAEAVGLANLEPGPSTIAIAAGVEVTVTQPLTLEQSVTIKGSGGRSIINWAPAQDDLGYMLEGDNVTMQVFDVEFKVTKPSMDPMIQLSSAVAEYPLVFERVWMTNLSEGGVNIESAYGGVLIDQVTVAGSPFGNDYSEGSVFNISDLNRGLTMKNSSFSETRMAGLIVVSAELAADEQILIIDNNFFDIDAQEVEASGIVLSIDSVEAVASPARAAVHIAQNQIDDIKGRTLAGVYLGSIEAGIMFAKNSVTNTNIEGNTLSVSDGNGAFGDNNVAAWIVGNTFNANTASEGSVLRFDGVTGTVLIADTDVIGSVVSETAINFEGLEHQDGPNALLVKLDGVTVDGVTGYDGNSIDYGVYAQANYGAFEIVNSTVSRVQAALAALSIFENNSSIRVNGSSFLDNSAIAMHLEQIDLDYGESVSIEGSTFARNVPLAGANASDLEVSVTGSGEADHQSLVIRNSTFDRQDRPSAALPSVLGITNDALALVEHVTMAGGAYVHECSPSGYLTVRNSAIAEVSAPVIDPVVCTVTGANNTVAVLGELDAASTDVLPVADWKLGALANNGGLTQTLLPADDSPLVDTAAMGDVLVDQRGIARPQGVAPDRGAVEVAAVVPVVDAVVMGPDVTVQAGSPAVLTVKRQGAGVGAVSAVIELQDGTAKDGDDYFADRFEVSWADGDTADKTIQIETIKNKAGSRSFTAMITSVTGADLGARDTATVTVTHDAVVPVKPVDPTKPLVNTGGEAPWSLWVLGGVLLVVGALAFRSKRQGATKTE
ncbi:choice-of-anchor Q domain-containing protein [Leucobacter sp. UT-8R-CII-1-4]|uniref:choice-of-anchor Q domain-containing protein n=1 Tax=Leucobacter sp. UT-8R-CII-1-4 TaxID=3040075 RepID=UPI0024A82F2D|nr:choice-of-anchor Q domain-containing protein [Leucobacter sp. UT-8R-CII-1-4]MDI6024008.1 choice-of-anchor Q domain-containing protein [Leucobacter sp. UT-8R-CII-1-4]